MIRPTGLSPPTGFHDTSGVTGSRSKLAASSAMWIDTWRRPGMRTIQCA